MIRISVITPDWLRHGSSNIKTALAVEVGRIAKDARDFMRREMKKPKNGMRYPRKGGQAHVASAPGEFPAVDSGTLYKAIEFKHRQQTAEIGALAGPHYATYLEGGTKRMLPRPYVAPTQSRYERLGPPRLFRAVMRALGRIRVSGANIPPGADTSPTGGETFLRSQNRG